MSTPRRLTQRQAKFVEVYLTGAPASEAAKQAGYAPSMAHRGAELLDIPAVAELVKGVRAAAREKAVYDIATAMDECLAVIEFAKLHKNAMAYHKSVELRAKLSGLLVERIDVRAVVDVRAALDEARSRVHNWNGPTPPPNPNPLD